MSIVLIVVARMLIAAACVAVFVVVDDHATRVWVGGGIMGIAIPATIYITRLNTKIGYSAGRCSATADMLQEHCRMHSGD